MAPMIDSHQHFWSLADPWFAWPTPDLVPIHRDIGPDELEPRLKAAGIDRTVLVQVAPALAETDRFLDIAEQTDFVAGVVGWVDLETRASIADLERLSTRDKFVGVRPMIQSISDVDWMLRPQLAPALAAVQRLGLTFDALVRPQHLSALCAFADRYPDLRLVVDHGAKPAIHEGWAGFADWAESIAALAQRPQVLCKLSGLLTEAGDRMSADDLAPFIDHLLKVFGPGRLMWGSDWPVLELVTSYGAWFNLARSHLARLSAHEQGLIFGEVAQQFYGLPAHREAP
jgi:L-fuconolactonase